MKHMLSILFTIFFVFGQKSNLTELYKSWQVNDIKNIEKRLKKEISSNPKNSEAHHLLALFYNQQFRYNDAWASFQKAIELEENPYPYIYAAWSSQIILLGETGKRNDRQDFLDDIIEQADSEGILRAMAHQAKGLYYIEKGEFDDAHEEFAKENTQDIWMLNGPYENISASGFDRHFEPEGAYDAKAEYLGKNNIPTTWFPVKKIRNDKWIDFNRYFAVDDAIYYANSFIYSDKDQVVDLRIGTSGSLKAFLNDEEVASVVDENNNDLDTYIIEVTLNKGWNRLLLKVGHSVISSANFLVRITSRNGQPIENLKASTEPKKYISLPGTNTATKIRENFAEAFFKKQIQADSTKLHNYMYLAMTYLRNDKATEAELVLTKMHSSIPTLPVVQLELLEAYIRGEKETQRATLVETMAASYMNIPIILNTKYQEYLEKKNFTEADKYLDALKRVLPNSYLYFEAQLGYYTKKDDSAKLIDLVNTIYSRFPNVTDAVLMKAAISLQISKSYTNSISILNDYLDDNYDVGMMSYLANFYFNSNEPKKGLDILERRIKNDPSATGFIEQLVGIYIQAQMYDDAERLLKDAMELCPSNSIYWQNFGKIHQGRGDTQLAIDAYEKSLKYMSTNYTSREQLRELQGHKSVFEEFKQYDIDALMAAAPVADDFPNAIGATLLKTQQTVIYNGGASEYKTRELYRVFTKSGIDDFTEHWISQNGYSQRLVIDEAFVVKEDGTKIKADINQNHLVFTNLEVHDFIYIEYRMRNFNSGALAKHFWDDFYFNSFLPMVKTEYSVMMPANFPLQYSTQNMEKKPVVTHLGENKILTWESSKQRAIEYEAKMPTLYDVGKILYVSSIPDWNFISQWYVDLARKKTEPTFEIEEKVAELLKGKEDASRMEKIRIIYEFIVENIRYSSVSFRQSGLIPQQADKVLGTKIGDCKDSASLFIAMLKVIGIQANHVLVNTRDEGRNEKQLPSINFNHCIASFYNDQNEIQYVDLTAINHSFGTLPNSDRGAFSLIIQDDASTPTYLPVAKTDVRIVDRKTKVVLDKKNLATITKNSKKTGTLAASFRANYRDVGNTDKMKDLKSTLASDHPSVSLLSFEIPDLLENKSDVHYNYTYTTRDMITEAGSFKIMSLPWSDDLSPLDALTYEKRVYPINFWFSRDTEIEEMSVELPVGAKIMELKKEVAFNSPFGTYKVTYKMVKNTLVAKRELKITKDYITAKEYDAFKTFYNNVLKEDEAKFLISN